MNFPQYAHDPSARFPGQAFWPLRGQKRHAPSRDPRRGGTPIAQGGRDARDRDDGAAARSDALMGTPNKKTPVPQDNVFSTSPRLEQQPPLAEPPAPRGATPAPAAAPR